MKNQSLTLVLLLASLAAAVPVRAQDAPPLPHRTRLILKDGSFQMVMSYEVHGNIVRYVSAERDGQVEDIPLKLVDLDETKKWDAAHTPGAKQQGRPPALDPELLKEEQERASLTPEVATNLHLPQQESVLVLDSWRDSPELIPLVQSDGDLNRTTGHSLLKGMLNPMASPHQIVQLKGEAAAVQLHVAQPSIFVRVGDLDESVGGGTPFVVNTGGSNSASGKSANIIPSTSEYVIVRTDVRTDARIVMSFRTSVLGTGKKQEDVIETRTEPLPGGHWLKITPVEPLLFGEYAMVEVINDRTINLGVWDFGVHPTAPENRDAIQPQEKRPFSLEHRRPE